MAILFQSSLLDQEDVMCELHDSSPSLRMISALKEIKLKRQQLDKVWFVIDDNVPTNSVFKNTTYGTVKDLLTYLLTYNVFIYCMNWTTESK